MSNIHKFKVEPIEGQLTCAKVSVDNEKCLCSSYEISHHAGEVPTAKISLAIGIKYEHDAIIDIANLHEIASLMDKNLFNRFCKIWGNIHNET